MTERELYENFQKTFGRMVTPFEMEDMRRWIHEVGLPVEVVNEALREAALNNKINLRYINKILVRCQEENIRTVEDFHRKAEDFAKQKEVARSSYGPAKPKQPNNPAWHDPDYKNTTSSQERAELEERRKQLLSRMQKGPSD